MKMYRVQMGLENKSSKQLPNTTIGHHSCNHLNGMHGGVHRFEFYEHVENRQPTFSCALESERCHSQTKIGTRCSRKCVIGTPYCWSHLLSNHHLRLLPSTVPNAGKGVFVLNKQRPLGEIIIRNGDVVCPYGGELIDETTLNRRYGDKTAPYALQLSQNRYRDAACARGVGSMINHDGRRANVSFAVNHRAKTVSIKAKRNLRNGEELFLSYGRDYRMNDGSRYVTRPR